MIRAEGLAKKFGPVEALRDVSMHLEEGEVLGLIGDNGAGKSTLIKILTGFHQPDAGQLYLDGEEVTLRSVSDARQRGIETVYQDLALINDLPVYLNMALKRESTLGWLPLLDRRRMRREARQRLSEIAIRLPSVDTEVTFLSGGQRQAIAVARAVFSDAKVLFLDEPLAAMGVKESMVILDLIRRDQAPRRDVDHHDRPQLRPDRRRLRPGGRPAARHHHLRPSGRSLIAAGADRTDRLGLPRIGRGNGNGAVPSAR